MYREITWQEALKQSVPLMLHNGDTVTLIGGEYVGTHGRVYDIKLLEICPVMVKVENSIKGGRK